MLAGVAARAVPVPLPPPGRTSPDFDDDALPSGVYKVAKNSQEIKFSGRSKQTTGGPWAQVDMDAGVNWWLAFQEAEIVNRNGGNKIPMNNLGEEDYKLFQKDSVESYNETNDGEKKRALEALGLPENIDVDFTFPQIIEQVVFRSIILPTVAVRIYIQRDDGTIECPDTPYTRINQNGYAVKDSSPVSLLFTMNYTTKTPNYQILKFYKEEPKSQEF